MREKVRQALQVIDDAVSEHDPSHVFACFSGGHDSVVVSHIASQHPAFSGAFHANTGIGIEQTREYVRETAQKYGWQLEEYLPQRYTYRQLVLRWGFPHGVDSHNKMLYYLKQHALERLVRYHKRAIRYDEDGKRLHWNEPFPGRHMHAWGKRGDDFFYRCQLDGCKAARRKPRNDRIGLVYGIRKGESTRRMQAKMSVPFERDGAQLSINPILEWSATDINDYMEYAGIERNEVVDLLHRSGECLCGALANHWEIVEIETWFEEEAGEIHDLESECEDVGLVDSVWAYPSQAPGKKWSDVTPDEVNTQMCMDCIGRKFAPEPPDAEEVA